MSKLRVGINGLGRTGRQVLRAWWEHHRDDFDIVAINGRTDVAMHTHLLRYDSDYGRFPAPIEDGADGFSVGGRAIRVFREDDPAAIDWPSVNVDLVIESTGEFESREDAAKHLRGTVKKVIISAPGKDDDWTVIMGVNHLDYDPARHHVISNGSCTTNCVVPMVKVLHDAFGVRRGLMTTIHAYTRDQNLVDAKHRDLRRARAAALNIIPTSTGAARSVGRVIPELEGKLNGLAYRVPTPTVSVVDLVTDLAQSASKGAVNEAFLAAAEGPMKGFLYFERDELVSTDFRGHPGSAIFDSPSTMVLEQDMVKTMGWYDNEYGYACRIADLIAFIGERGLE
ncbi:MAG: type I glyceraldehyde-3-phosphate dehydrogenase [Chloroflexi bacterium]|nr:type I glyceraldehyde-3-phosphate dehydrogenase [Chloroflexota bacterium]